MEDYKLRVFQNRVLRKISGPKRNEVPEDWGRLLNDYLQGIYFSPYFIWLFKSRKLKWANNVARMGRVAYRV